MTVENVVPPASPPAAQNSPPLPFDAALPAAPAIPSLHASDPFSQVADAWRAQIDSEHLHDIRVPKSELTMRWEDGSISRGGGPLAYTPHGFGQLINLLLSAKPNNLAACLRWLSPMNRAPAFTIDVLGLGSDASKPNDASKLGPAVKPSRCTRKDADLIVLRTYRAPRPGVFAAGANPGVQAIRAAVSVRHGLQYTDDRALIVALEAELGADANATVSRSVDSTRGYAEVGAVGPHLTRTMHWENSETGCASLSFSAGAVIKVVDAKVVVSGAEVVTKEEEVTARLADTHAAERMRHTAPGGKNDEARKATIATERMRSKIRAVLAKTEQLGAAWEASLLRFSRGLDAASFSKLEPAVAWEVLADAIEEATGFEREDRAALLALLTDETRLGGSATLPRGSAGHVAAAFAVLGERAEDIHEQTRYQVIAGRWPERSTARSPRRHRECEGRMTTHRSKEPHVTDQIDPPLEPRSLFVTHLLEAGLALCGFGEGAPLSEWPPGHVWIRADEPGGPSCDACRLKLMQRVGAQGMKALATPPPLRRFAVFAIRKAKGASVWVRVGNAITNRDGSMNVMLDALPLDGKLHLREGSSASRDCCPTTPPNGHHGECSKFFVDGTPRAVF